MEPVFLEELILEVISKPIKKDMNWYIAKLVFQIINHSQVQQFEEQVRLIEALDYESALQQAESIGKSEEDEFLTIEQKKVYWKFEAVIGLSLLESPVNGTEICSRIFETNPSERYLESVQIKRNELVTPFDTASS